MPVYYQFMLKTLLCLCLVFSLPVGAAADQLVGVRWSSVEELDGAARLGLTPRFVGPDIALLSAAGGAADLAARAGLEVVFTDAPERDPAHSGSWYLSSDLHGTEARNGTVVYRHRRGWAVVRLDPGPATAALAGPGFLYPLPESYSLEGLRLTPAPRAAQAPELAGPAAVLDLVSQVDDSQVRAHVRRLALLDTAAASTFANLRTRYCLRPETYESTRYIRDQLAAVLGESAVSIRAFDLEIGDLQGRVQDLTPADALRMYNVIGELPGTDPTAGYYLICAHYDAIGSRTKGGWNWRTDPAPGADDNASGVAAVLEAARVLSQVDLPWTVRFALWSGEELGLHGSREYAGRAGDDDDRILGVINIDMVGYNRQRNRVELVTNPASQWIVDLLEGANERYDIGLQIDVLKDAFAALSDHAPFWARGYDAILAIENYLPSDTTSAGVTSDAYVPYTAYHSTADVPDSVNWELVGDLTRLSVAALGQYGQLEGKPNLAVFSGDVSGDARDDLRVRVSNLGRSPVAGPVRVRVSLCGLDSTGCAAIYDEEQTLPLDPGAAADITVPWRRYGDAVLLVEVDPAGRIDEELESDNRAYQSLRLLPQASVVAYPNPYAPGRDAVLSFSGVPLFGRVEISSATGQSIWRGREEEQGSLSREILWRGVNEAGFGVSSGVYIYSVTSFEGELIQRDKIAVVRAP